MSVHLAFVPSPTTWRRPGCDERCLRFTALVIGEDHTRAIESHDPDAHEDYVREAMGAARPSRYRGAYKFGPLTVDLKTGNAWVLTMPITNLTPIEWKILSYLVSNPERVVTYGELLLSVWGEAYSDKNTRLVHVNLQRLRAKLWEAAPLIQTVIGRGVKMHRELPR